jgi:hypothetical protein
VAGNSVLTFSTYVNSLPFAVEVKLNFSYLKKVLKLNFGCKEGIARFYMSLTRRLSAQVAKSYWPDKLFGKK